MMFMLMTSPLHVVCLLSVTRVNSNALGAMAAAFSLSLSLSLFFLFPEFPEFPEFCKILKVYSFIVLSLYDVTLTRWKFPLGVWRVLSGRIESPRIIGRIGRLSQRLFILIRRRRRRRERERRKCFDISECR